VASVVGIGSFAGTFGGIIMSLFTGAQLQATGSYALVFLFAGCAYMIALLVVHLLAPKLEPARLGTAAPQPPLA